MLAGNGGDSYGASRTIIDAFRTIALVVAITVGAVNTASASPAGVLDDNICLHWAETAAREQMVPIALMKAIATVESGRRSVRSRDPWPWTVHFDGSGYWFDTASEAKSFIAARLDRGARNIDVGCFQVNVKWHGARFASLSDMLDPSANARYAASFLKDLRLELGSWEAAAAAYHSRTPEHARRYRQLLQPVLARFGGMEPASDRQAAAFDGRAPADGRTQNLVRRSGDLDAQGTRALASLVPLGFQGAARPLF